MSDSKKLTAEEFAEKWQDEFPGRDCECSTDHLAECAEAYASHQNSVLEAERDRLLAENKKLDERHVRFMVEGGPVVMSADYDKLQSELTEAKSEITRLTRQVAEKQALNEYFRDGVGECHLMISRQTSEYQARDSDNIYRRLPMPTESEALRVTL